MPNNTPAPADLVEAVAKAAFDARYPSLMKADPDFWDTQLAEPSKVHWRRSIQAAITAMQAHMASDGVVQADRDRAATIYRILGFGQVQHIIDGAEDDIGVVQEVGAHRRAAAGKGDAPDCQTCGGAGEIFGHAPGCDSDYCALAGSIDDCAGLVEPCPACTPQPDPRDAEIERLRVALAAKPWPPTDVELKEMFATVVDAWWGKSGGNTIRSRSRLDPEHLKGMYALRDVLAPYVARTALANSEGKENG